MFLQKLATLLQNQVNQVDKKSVLCKISEISKSIATDVNIVQLTLFPVDRNNSNYNNNFKRFNI